MKYKRNEDIKTTLMPDGHVVLFNSKTEWAQVLNPMGALVWEFCDGYTSVDDMTGEIASLLQIENAAILQNDINSLISEFLGLGLVCETAAGKPS